MSFEALRPPVPLAGFRFAVTFAFTPSAGAFASGAFVPFQAGFSEVSGLAGSIETHTYQEGGRNDRVLKFPTRADYGNVTFRRGMSFGREIFDWYDQVRRGSFGARRSILVAQLDGRGNPALVWYLFRAFPIAYTAPSLDAGQSALSIESLEVAHEGIELIPGDGRAIEQAKGAV